MDTLFKPIPLLLNTYGPSHTASTAMTIDMINTSHENKCPGQCVAVAGSDINLDAQVYLLYEMPTSLLARRFNFEKNENIYKIMVGLFFNKII